MIRLTFVKSDACADDHRGEPDNATVEAAAVQLTYGSLIRDTSDDSDIARVAPCECYVVAGNHYSDLVIDAGAEA